MQTSDTYADAKETLAGIIDIIKPPKRITVTECAEKHVFLKGAAYTGYYKASMSPLMREPADALASRELDSVILVAGAQQGKTQGIPLNGVAHKIIADPMDVMIVEKDKTAASDFSLRRIDRMLNESPDLKERLRPGKYNDTTFKKIFKSGQILNMGWPSRNQLAGKPIGFMLGTDYDRWPDNVGGEGSGFDQMNKRTTTYMSKGMCAVESTPSKEVTDPTWVPTAEFPHEAPPTTGILGLYNTGDRRMVYGKCPHCEEYFAPSPNPDVSMYLPEAPTVEERAEGICLMCSNCGSLIGLEHEREFRKTGTWVKEGQTIDSDGVIYGEGRKSKRASFWAAGWFASFNSWYELGLTYARGEDEYNRTGEEESLKNCYNQEFAYPYISRSRRSAISDFQVFKDRAGDWERFSIPEGVRTVITTVDVQGGKGSRFEVGRIGMGEDNRAWYLDRYTVSESKRGDRVQPSTYLEDWDLLTERVNATFKLEDGKELMNHILAVDCGGEDGVYDQALKWYRALEPQIKAKVYLVRGMGGRKGTIAKNADKTKLTYPDSRTQSNRKVSSKGDVPVLMVNTDRFKDDIANALERDFDGWGFVTFPKFFKDEHYNELLNSEVRTETGWDPIRGKLNETLDLLVYALAVWHERAGHMIDWNRPPGWAAEFDKNTNVVSSGVRKEVKARPIRRVHSAGR